MTGGGRHGRSALEPVLLAALGAAHTLLFVETAFGLVQIAVVAVLAWRVALATPRRAAWLGFAFGTGWLCAGTWWLFVSMHRYGGLPAWMAALAVVGLAAVLSLYLAAAMAAVARWRGTGVLRFALLFAATWLLAELARGVFFTGFPWLASGYAHVDSPLAGFAPWIGVYGMGALAAGLGAALGAAAAGLRDGAKRGARPLAAPVAALAVALVAGALLGRVDFTQASGTLNVSLLQGNVPQDEKFSSRYVPQALAGTAAQFAAARGALVIGPETVIPLLPSQLDAEYMQALRAPFVAPGRAAVFGIPLGDPGSGYTNSALGISAATNATDAGAYRYDKHHLVPFGEFIPLGFKWFTRMMNIPLGDFNRGPETAPSFAFQGERIAPNICYEDLFGEELAARFVPAADAPTILANISNIGWFGRTVALDQHLQISRLRSLELQRPMLRATNTGTTAIVDHRGVVTHALPVFTRGILEGTVQGRTGLTPFATWAGRLGLWPLWTIGVATLVFFMRRRTP